MRKGAIAEWILSLVAPPERAASAVGDLLEEKRGSVWFWAAIARTTVALFWRGVATDGLNMAWVALVGWCFSAFLILAMQLIFNLPRLMADHVGLGWIVATQQALRRIWAEPPLGVILWSGGFYSVLPTPGKRLLSWMVRIIVWSLMCVLARVPTDQLFIAVFWGMVWFSIRVWSDARRVKAE